MAEKPEDLSLPHTSINRIIKDALPEGTIVSKEARTAISRAACIFVLYATAAATNIATKSNRKTITGNDIIEAMEELEFEDFVEQLKETQESFKSFQSEKNAAKKKKKSLEKPTDTSATATPDKHKNGTMEDKQSNGTMEEDDEPETIVLD